MSNDIHHDSLGFALDTNNLHIITSIDDLLIALSKSSSKPLKWRIIGDCTSLNIINKDSAYLVNKLRGFDVLGDKVYVKSGEKLDEVIGMLNSKGLKSLNKLSDIPGTIGGSVANNVSYLDDSIGRHIISVDCYDTTRSMHVTLNAKECQFGYKSSLFSRKPSKLVMLGALLKVSRSGEDRFKIIKSRRAKMPYPKNLPKTISPFTNPILNLDQVNKLKNQFPNVKIKSLGKNIYSLDSGQLLELTNLNGYCDRNFCSFSLKDIVITHSGKGSPEEYKQFISYIVNYVKELSGVELEVRNA